MPSVLYADGTGELVSIPLFNTYLGAISGHGKTVLMKAYIKALSEEHPDLRMLVVDSTDDQEYGDLGREIRLCFVETSDPFVLKELLGAITHLYMDRYIGEIIDELSLAKTLREGCEAMEAKVKAATAAGADRKKEGYMHPVARKNVLIVASALRKLIDLADRMHVVNTLELQPGINRMNISLKGINPELKLGFQQLIVRSVALKLVNEWRDVVLILDEGRSGFRSGTGPWPSRPSPTCWVRAGSATSSRSWPPRPRPRSIRNLSTTCGTM